MVYACPVWSMTCKSNFRKLQVIQNKFLRIIGNYRKFTPINCMHEELRIEYIENYILTIVRNYFNRLENHSNRLVNSITSDINIGIREL